MKCLIKFDLVLLQRPLLQCRLVWITLKVSIKYIDTRCCFLLLDNSIMGQFRFFSDNNRKLTIHLMLLFLLDAVFCSMIGLNLLSDYASIAWSTQWLSFDKKIVCLEKVICFCIFSTRLSEGFEVNFQQICDYMDMHYGGCFFHYAGAGSALINNNVKISSFIAKT